MQVGSIVICINDNFDHRAECEAKGWVLPKKDSTYTIRNFVDSDFILLEEIVNSKDDFTDGYGEICFCIDQFRELLPPISISQAIEQLELVTV